MNIDLNEIKKFDALASQWWDRDGDFKTLHDINPLRANWIDKIAPVAGQRLLDVGCGGGILCEAMAHRGAKVTGIDAAEGPLSVADLHKIESGVIIDYIRSTAEDFAIEQPQKFDIVTCLEMLEHVPAPWSVVEACSRLVKPGGTVFFSTINRNPKSYLMAVIGAEYLLRLLPIGTHDYAKFIKPSELRAWLRDANLELEAMTGLVFDLIGKSYRLTVTDVDVNYMLCARKPD